MLTRKLSKIPGTQVRKPDRRQNKMSIRFYSNGINFRLPSPSRFKKIILSVFKKEKKTPGEINFIFCSDAYLYKLNKKFLKHDYYTDVLTFPDTEEKNISGEIFVSIPRVKSNSKKYNQSYLFEIQRVMIHGVLHLCGYLDKSTVGKKRMRKLEDRYITSL